MNGTPHRWDSWAQWAAVIVVLLGAFWYFAGAFAAMRQQLADVVENQSEMTHRLERLENRYPFPPAQRVQ